MYQTHLEFQSAFIAVARLTVPVPQVQQEKPKRFNPLSSRWPVSQSMRRPAYRISKVSIRFHRGGPSHQDFKQRSVEQESFQSAFIAVARLT